MIASIKRKLACVTLCTAGIFAAPTAFAQTVYEFNLPQQPLAESLRAIARRTLTNVVFEPMSVENKIAPAVRGQLSASEAIDRALGGSQLTAEHTDAKTVVLIQSAGSQTTSVGSGAATAEARGVEDIRLAQSEQPGTAARAREGRIAEGPQSGSTVASEAGAQIDEIVVTGSRIRRSGADAPIPTTIMDSAVIDSLGATSLAEITADLPSIGVGINGQNNNLNLGNAGLNLLDLRSLGYTRTLVLINGRRQVGSQAGNTSVDISTISPALVERIETITGGASAVYGADAVSGVVNFIMKRNFEGLQFDAQGGGAQHGAAEDQSYSVTAGSNLADDRGNVTVHLNYARNNGHLATDRDFSKTSLSYQDAGGGRYQAVNDSVIRLTAPEGISIGVFNDGFGVRAWSTDGNFIDAAGSPIFSFVNQQGGIGLRTMDYAQPRPRTERLLFNANFDYAVTDHVKFIMEGKYARTTANIHGQPAYFGSFGSFARPARINIDNPYLHPDVVSFMSSRGMSTITVEKASDELGYIDFENTRNLMQFVGGFEGEFGEGWQWTATYQYGRSEAFEEGLDRDEARAQQAIDVIRDSSGQIVCRDQRNGCVPMNIFGRQTLSPEVIGFMMFRDTDKSQLTQQVTMANISGHLFDLPAGKLGVSAGVEYRREASEFLPSQAHQLGTTYRTNAGRLYAVEGDYDVKEAFGEVLVPLLADLPAAKLLSLDAAVRVSDYSTSGSSTAWKTGLEWTPIDVMRLRANYSKSVRAPNIAELFSPQQPGFGFVEDPCHQANRGLGANPARREANCLALGLPGDFQSDAETAVRTLLTSGNLQLQPETSKTWTLGAVFTPQFAPGLSITADYWDIRISDAIQAFSANNILGNCVDFDSIDNTFCALVARNASGQIESIQVKQINIAEFTVSGVDFEIGYALPLTIGTFNFNLLGTRLLDKDYLETAGSANVDEQAGNTENPQWQGILRAGYERGDWSASWQTRYVGRSMFDPQEVSPRSDRKVPSYLISNTQVRYRWHNGLEVYTGVNNVFDKIPPRRGDGIFAGQGIAGSFYDTVGRFFYAGMRVKL